MNHYKFQFVAIAGLGATLVLSTLPVNFESGKNSVFIKQPDIHQETFPYSAPMSNFVVAGITTSSNLPTIIQP